MDLFDAFLEIADFIEDMRFGKRYGFGSFLWELACLVCLFVAVFSFSGGWYILGIISAVATVLCFVFSIRRCILDIKQKHRAKSPES